MTKTIMKKKNIKGKQKATPATTKKKTTIRKKATEATKNNSHAREIVKPKKAKIVTYISAKDLKIFRSMLLKWKNELVDEADRKIEEIQGESVSHADFNDRASVEEEFTLQLKSQDRERKLIRKIDQSIETIDNGEYGYCAECGEEIGVARLKARPTATLCIECKQLAEIKEKQYA